MIDWRRVNELRDEVGAEDFAEIVEMFLEEVEETVSSLEHGPSLAEGLHFLKGSALNLGFSELAETCSTAEANPETADLAIIESQYASARAHFLDALEQGG